MTHIRKTFHYKDHSILKITRESDVLFKFNWATNNYKSYLTENYAVTPAMPNGFVRCNSEAEAEIFLKLLYEFWDSGRSINPDELTEVVNRLYRQALTNAINQYIDDYYVELNEIPLRNVELPREVKYYSDFRSWDADHFLYTLNWSDLYGAYPSYDLPEVSNCLLVNVNADTGSELSLNLAEENLGFEKDSLEVFLILQQLCHNKDLSKEFPEYAYFRYDLMGGIWLKPIPEAAQTLVEMQEAKYGCFADYSNFSDVDKHIKDWLQEIKTKITEETEEEVVELIDQLTIKYLEGGIDA